MRSAFAFCAALSVLVFATPLAAEETPAAAPSAPSAPADAPAPSSAATPAPPPQATPPPAAAAAPKPAPKPKPVTLVLRTDLAAQRLHVIENGREKYVWPISSGRREFATPGGTYHVTWTAKNWFSRQYDDAPMPHSVFFNGGIAFHGTYAVRQLGRPVSHGCVRLAPGNAATLYKLVHRHGYGQTKVVVYGTAKYGEPLMADRASREDMRRWDRRSSWDRDDDDDDDDDDGRAANYRSPYRARADQWSFIFGN
jgi:lipoprotein-anchoring transpeptidase ErfK/SrfK